MFNFKYHWSPQKQAKPPKEKPAPSPETLARWQCISGRVLLGVAFAPWLTLAAWTAYAEAARLALGHYPQQMWEAVPRPVDDVFGPLSALSLLLLVVSVPAFGGLMLGHTYQWKDATVWRASVIYGLGWASLILVSYLDPVGFVNWFID